MLSSGIGNYAEHCSFVMHRLIASTHTASRHRRQYSVLALVALLCVWMLTAATHAHGPDDVAHVAGNDCAVCVMLPSAAPAPTTLAVLLPVLQQGTRLVDAAQPIPVLAAAASYQSRAPPMR